MRLHLSFSQIDHYKQLIRFDRPIGTLLLLWPTLCALWLASGGSPQISNLIIFSLGCLVMRSAGCVINDYADRKIDPHVARKAWIFAMKPQGALRLDAGAVRALADGKSLLPAGVSKVIGVFERGDSVAIEDPDGHALGYGLTRYTSAEAEVIKGHKSREIEKLLGYAGRAALVHRDDMAL